MERFIENEANLELKDLMICSIANNSKRPSLPYGIIKQYLELSKWVNEK
tara:strand:+ start:318 stop:464 length:147 start_codon:yes stop_codon:yes gene_type:complete